MSSMGIKLEVPESITAEEFGPELELPSGRKARQRPGKGRDVRMAMLAVGQPFDQYRYTFAMIARRTLVDGKPITAESLDEMSEADVMVLLSGPDGSRPTI